MPQLPTQFGLLEYEDGTGIDFPQGMPGFEHNREFVLIEQADIRPIVFLQSAVAEGPCFIALPVEAIDPAYEPELSPDERELLSPNGDAILLWLAILTAAENGPPTANLLAPVAVNLERRVGVQAVRSDQRYSYRHPLGEAGPCS